MGEGQVIEGDERATQQKRPLVILGETREAGRLRAICGDAFSAGEPDRGGAVVVDARHAFAADPAPERASASAYARLIRPEWTRQPRDVWRLAPTPAAAVAALSPAWRRVLIALGRGAIEEFANDPSREYFVRVRGEPDACLPLENYRVLSAPGPYSIESEVSLFRQLGIDAVVARNDGGAGAYPKIAAARRMGCPVVMLERPPLLNDGPIFGTVEQAFGWILDQISAPTAAPRPTGRRAAERDQPSAPRQKENRRDAGKWTRA